MLKELKRIIAEEPKADTKVPGSGNGKKAGIEYAKVKM